MLRQHERSLDVTQWVFMRAIEVGFEVRSPAESLSWLYRTATQRCLWLMRNERSRREIRGRHHLELVPTAVSPEQSAVDRDLVVRALQQVDEQTGQIALLTWMQGFTNHRAAEICEVSTRTVNRARKNFEAVLQQLKEAP